VNKPPETPPRRVVLAPDIIAKSFLLPSCRTVLELWRDAKIQLVVTRKLLVIYLKLLRDLGIADAQLHRWAVWFTGKDKSVFLPESNSGKISLRKILHEAARLGDAEGIVSTNAAGELPVDGNTPWVSVDDFLKDYNACC